MASIDARCLAARQFPGDRQAAAAGLIEDDGAAQRGHVADFHGRGTDVADVDVHRVADTGRADSGESQTAHSSVQVFRGRLGTNPGECVQIKNVGDNVDFGVGLGVQDCTSIGRETHGPVGSINPIDQEVLDKEIVGVLNDADDRGPNAGVDAIGRLGGPHVGDRHIVPAGAGDGQLGHVNTEAVARTTDGAVGTQGQRARGCEIGGAVCFVIYGAARNEDDVGFAEIAAADHDPIRVCDAECQRVGCVQRGKLGQVNQQCSRW